MLSITSLSKIVLKVLLFGVVLTCVLFVVLLVINTKDAQPTVRALSYEHYYDNWPEVEYQRNGYIYALGFSTEKHLDPMELGLRRLEWLKELTEKGGVDDPYPDSDGYEFKADYSDAIQSLFDECHKYNADCLDGFLEHKEEVRTWLDEYDWLVARYLNLISIIHWREHVPFTSETELPPYGAVLDGQKITFIKMLIMLDDGNEGALKDFLEKDLKFWRNVLKSSDILIGKMISSSAIERHFQWGVYLLNQASKDRVSDLIPLNWHQPITSEERSMRRCFIGEWKFSDSIIRNLDQKNRLNKDKRFVSDVMKTLTMLLLKIQDSNNQRAEKLEHYAKVLETDYENLEMTVEKERERTTERSLVGWLYNPIGNYLESLSGDFYGYGFRVTDLEGVRRVALLAVLLRNDDAQFREKILTASMYQNPYQNSPMLWTLETQSLIFRGLSEGEYGIHRFTVGH